MIHDNNGKIIFPKRRKSKDNPYTIGYCTTNSSYTLTFLDGTKSKQTLFISNEIYEVMNQFELDDLSQMNDYDRNIEHSELTESTLYNRAVALPQSLEDKIAKKIERECLYKAINKLSDVQRRRLILYYFEGYTMEEIAKFEGCSPRAIKYSLDCAEKNLKNIF